LDLAGISLAALLATILVSCTTRVNPGLLALVFAWVIGVYLAPMWDTPIGMKKVLAGFPMDLFLTLVSVTLLFTQAQVNGTLAQVARAAMRGCRGNVGLMPVMFFLLAFGLASVGAGSIPAAALVASTAMSVAARTGISPFLMTIMVAHGCVAGGLSPFAPTGLIANGLMRKLSLEGREWQSYLDNLIVNFAVAGCGYLLFGGWRLFRRGAAPLDDKASPQKVEELPFRLQHGVTLAVIVLLIVGVICFKADVGMCAMTGAVLLTLLRIADERATIQAMPWAVILMVCGVSVLTALLEETGGADRFTSLVGRVATPRSIPAVIALLTGIISIYSSTSGVVLPTFLPLVPKFIEQVGGGDPWAIAMSIVIGGNVVDAAPLSTIGAICVASAAVGTDRRMLFHKLLAWSFAMAFVAAGVCHLLFIGL
jgi:di/tricarboxylate transporter